MAKFTEIHPFDFNEIVMDDATDEVIHLKDELIRVLPSNKLYKLTVDTPITTEGGKKFQAELEVNRARRQ